jgi:hypothetical protein
MSRYIAYYKIQPDFEEPPQEMYAQQFFADYRPVEILKANSLHEVYYRMQGDVWSPNGEMRDFIKLCGLSHTSMSVGDVIYSEEFDTFFGVCSFGFEVLTLTNYRKVI